VTANNVTNARGNCRRRARTYYDRLIDRCVLFQLQTREAIAGEEQEEVEEEFFNHYKNDLETYLPIMTD